MLNRDEKAARRAANKKDKKYAAEISSLIRLTDDEIMRLFPSRSEKVQLLELLQIVTANTDENEKIVKLKENIDNLACVAIKLVELLA